MAKLTVIFLIYVMVFAASLTSCLAFRQLRTELPSGDTDKIEKQEVVMSSRRTGTAAALVSTEFQKSSITAESDTGSVEHAGVVSTDSDSEDLDDVDEMGPCVEDTDTGRDCHRMLGDYPAPSANKNPKHH